jgi:hypothetical protein
MGHLAKHLGRRRQRPSQPFDGVTKAELWAQLQGAERRCERAAQLANDLGRDLRQNRGSIARESRLVRNLLSAFSDRAYAVRDVARGDREEST